MTITTGIGAALFSAILMLTVGHRLHKQDKHPSARMIMFLAGSLALTFTAAAWFPPVYTWTSHGLGIAVDAVVLGAGGADFYLHVFRKSGFDKARTARAAIALGVAGMLTVVNFTGIVRGIQGDFSGTSYTRVVSRVQQAGG
jgi:hypothetical protein